MDHEDRKRHFMTWYLLAAMIGIFLFQYLWINYTQVETVPYSQFEQLVNDGKVPRSRSARIPFAGR
jgi:cell division protease FtsH